MRRGQVLRLATGSVSGLLRESGALGKSVNLTVKLNLPTQREVQWKFGANSIIATAQLNNPPLYYGSYRGRCHLYDNTTLQLDNLTPADTGVYWLFVSNVDTAAQQNGSISLTVYSPLTLPTLKVNISTTNGNAYPVNGTNVSLHCDAGGQNVVNYTFYQGVVDACSQPHVTCNKDFMYFQPITMSDTGIYTCKIENPISSNTSQPLSIIVTGRLSGVTLSSNASSELLWAGKDSVDLTCSALGTNVTFSWYLDGAPLPPNPRYHLMNSNSSLIISPVERTDSGSFTCIGSNSLNSETSNLLTLRLGWFPNRNIQCNAARSDQTVTLSCSWPGGNPAANVTMIFQNTKYTAQDTVTRDVPLNVISPGAELTCLGAQGGQDMVCTMILGTPIGSQSNTVSSVTKGENVSMSVNLNWSRNVSPRIQILPATFSWFHRSSDRPLSVSGGKISVISSDYKSELVISSVTDSDNGIYECEAKNFLGNSTFSFQLSVTSGSNQLSPGAIAGIVISVLFVVALIPLTIIFILRKKKKNNNNNAPTSPVYENTGAQAPNTYDRIITGSKETMAGNRPQESSYQELQFPSNDVYNHLRRTPR
ncbi:carcinoembryonic antigen-related cell adhesion molecule 5 isoform X2 [Xenopus laevis]|uniref:Carcinoembryonic antigen-related cell adhesion molecule 5 isoform X2 n=1 Tax=Xenopus laevis TaxID=8355 RepID=A0A8J1L7I9_XENLA|nr:carcinoembryonic antigen-related cell adhesion molecule 5 isoform X2 [Xenopus laevis]